MDTRTAEHLPRPLRGAAPQAGKTPVLRDLGAPARPRISGEAQRCGEGGLSPAVEWFEERAAMIEFDGGLSRSKAESMAFHEVSAHMGKAAGREAYDHMNARRGPA